MDCLVRGVTKSWTQLSDFRVMMSAGGMQSTLLLLLTSVFALGSSKVAVGFFGFFFKLILFLAVLGLCCCSPAVSSGRERGLLSRCSARASHCGGFSCCRAGAPGHSDFSSCCSRLSSTGLVVVVQGLSQSEACGIFPDLELNPCPCTGRRILNHWTTREVPLCIFCPEFALAAQAWLFLVPYILFVFCCSRRGVSRCKPCSKGPQAPIRLKPAVKIDHCNMNGCMRE